MLKMSTGASAALMLNPGLTFGQNRAMIMRTIPSSDEKIPAVGLGTSSSFRRAAGAEGDPLKEVIDQFARRGGMLIDTAPSYGDSEPVIGGIVSELGIRNKLFIATKVRTEGHEAGIAEMEASFSRLQTDVIDLMQVHNLTDVETQLATMREWRDAGRIRYIGVTTSSNRAHEAMAEVISREELDFMQINYNLGQRNAAEKLLPMAMDKGLAVLTNLPFGRGRLFGTVGDNELPDWASEFDCGSWAQFFLKFIISHPGNVIPIPATSDPDHLIDNVGAAFGRLPDQQMRKRMEEYFDSLGG